MNGNGIYLFHRIARRQIVLLLERDNHRLIDMGDITRSFLYVWRGLECYVHKLAGYRTLQSRTPQ